MQKVTWPPPSCPHCSADFARRGHRGDCPAKADEPLYHEVFPRLFVGSVEARVDPRFVAVVSVLTEALGRFIGARLAQPSVPMAYIEHEDGVEGLVAKCGPAWQHIDRFIGEGDVLVHCHKGASRSVTVAAGWVITRHRQTVLEFLPKIVVARPQAMFLHPGYVEELLALELTHQSI